MNPTLETADSRSKRRKRRAPQRYANRAINRDPLARSTIKQQIKKDPDAPVVETKRWVDLV